MSDEALKQISPTRLLSQLAREYELAEREYREAMRALNQAKDRWQAIRDHIGEIGSFETPSWLAEVDRVHREHMAGVKDCCKAMGEKELREAGLIKESWYYTVAVRKK